MLMFGRVRALIAVRNEIVASRMAEYFELVTGDSQKLEMAATSQPSNGAESGTSPYEERVGFALGCRWCDLKSGPPPFFRVRNYCPKNGSPPKIRRGVPVTRPKKRTSIRSFVRKKQDR